jgi:hypothetical protein
MSLLFLFGAIVGSGVMLTVARAPAHRAVAAVKARLAQRDQ